MILLYEICIWLAWFDRKKQREREAVEEQERQDWVARRAVEDRDSSGQQEAAAGGAGSDPSGREPGGDQADPYEYGEVGDYPDDYDWDKEYEQFHQDSGMAEGEEESEDGPGADQAGDGDREDPGDKDPPR